MIRTVRQRAGSLLQRLAGRLVASVPAPPDLTVLSSQRGELSRQLLARRGAEIEEAKEALRHARLANRSSASSSAAAARDALGVLGESLVHELRSELVRATSDGRAGRLAQLASTADGWLATNETEYLDLPHFDEARRTRELRGIDLLNRGFGSYSRFADALAPLIAPVIGDDEDRVAAAADRPITVLDIASGHGGFPLALAALSSGRRRPLRIIASDLRGEYLDIGRRSAHRDGLDHVEFVVADALDLGASFAPGEIDVITCTQSLHHFGAQAVCGLLCEAVRHARRGVLFIDLARAPSATVAATALGVLTMDAALMHDAVLSFRKAFVPEELGLLAACVPGGEALEAIFLPPAFTALRTRR